MTAEKFFFLGFVVDDRLKAGLQDCRPADRTFLENPMYLEQVTIQGASYIGRRLDEVVSLEEVNDAARNVQSLISRIVAGWEPSEAGASLIPVEEEIFGEDVQNS